MSLRPKTTVRHIRDAYGLFAAAPNLQTLWKVRFTEREAPALASWLASGEARLGDLLRNPEDRGEPLHAVALLLLRGEDATLAPDATLANPS